MMSLADERKRRSRLSQFMVDILTQAMQDGVTFDDAGQIWNLYATESSSFLPEVPAGPCPAELKIAG